MAERTIYCADANNCPMERVNAEQAAEIHEMRDVQSQILQAVARIETRMQERDRATQIAMGVIGMLIAVATWGLGMLLGTRK